MGKAGKILAITAILVLLLMSSIPFVTHQATAAEGEGEAEETNELQQWVYEQGYNYTAVSIY